MDYKQVLSIASGFITLAAYVPLLLAIKRGLRPPKSSWISWTLLDLVTVAGMALKGAVSGIFLGATFGTAIVALVTLRVGKPGWDAYDKTALASSIIGGSLLAASFLIPATVADLQTFGLAASLMGLLIAVIPTCRAAWHEPEKEDKATWALFLTATILTLLSIRHWTFAEVAPAITFFANIVAICGVIAYRLLTSKTA